MTRRSCAAVLALAAALCNLGVAAQSCGAPVVHYPDGLRKLVVRSWVWLRGE